MAEAEAATAEKTPYELLGPDGVRALSKRFYEIMAETPEAASIRAMHQADLAPIVDKLTGFLSGWLGGPRDYFTQPNSPCIMSLHHAYPIGAAERDQWLACMRRALDETVLEPGLRDKISQALAKTADAMRSR